MKNAFQNLLVACYGYVSVKLIVLIVGICLHPELSRRRLVDSFLASPATMLVFTHAIYKSLQGVHAHFNGSNTRR